MNGIVIGTINDVVEINPERDASGLIVSGVAFGNIDFQRAHYIIILTKGEIKEYPALGFGLKNWLKRTGNDIKQKFIQELTTELKADGFEGFNVVVGDSLINFQINGL